MTEFIRPARAAIIEYLYRIASWRRAKADEYDRDPRNIRSADAIEEFAEFIASLPEDEPRIVRLGQLGMEGDTFYPGQQSSYEIGRYRFFDDAGEHDAFLTAVVELAERDAGEHGHFGGTLPPGDDPWE
jgi:hypothetical protein